MEKLNSFNPAEPHSAFSDVSPGNFGIVVPINSLLDVRDAHLVHTHLRRVNQDRPFHYFSGAAEAFMLNPCADYIARSLSGPDMLSFLLAVARNFGTASRAIGMLKSQQGVGSLSNLVTMMTPDLVAPGIYDIHVPGSSPQGTNPATQNGYAVFTDYLYQVMTNPAARANIAKTLADPTAKPRPGINVSAPPTEQIINAMIQNTVTFGTRGKGTPLLAGELEKIISRRYTVESYLSSSSSTRFDRDSKFALALWYLMYCEIVQTPASYDAALPIIDLTPNNSTTAAALASKMGSVAKTAFSALSSPQVFAIDLFSRQLKDFHDFLKPLAGTSPDISSKIDEALGLVENHIPDVAYSPVRHYVTDVYDYFKRMTGARYLLPEFAGSLQTHQGVSPFTPLSSSMTADLPSNYRGYLAGAQRTLGFGGLDVPMALEAILYRAKELLSNVQSLNHVKDALLDSMATPSGDVLVHLSTLGAVASDPVLGEIAYPSVTETYVVPSYVPRFHRTSTGSPSWFLSDRLYKPFFPGGLQISRVMANATSQPRFSWDTEVQVGLSPSSGVEFACLPLPLNYVDDAMTDSIVNNISSVKQFLSSSPYRPMKDVADFFTPMFQGLTMGTARHDAIANALAAIGFIYRSTGKGSGKLDDPASWDILAPQMPFIYGMQTSALMKANAPWSQDRPATMDHVELSADMQYMFCLHRALPQEVELSYLPFIMFGGFTVSLPIPRSLEQAALGKLINQANPVAADSLYGAVYSHATQAPPPMGLYEVKAWASSLAYFPHIFLANRYTASSTADLVASISGMTNRYRLLQDQHSPYGTLLTYLWSEVGVLDIKDQLEALAAPVTLDINGVNKAAKAARSRASDPDPVTVKHSPLEVVNELIAKEEAAMPVQSQTATGSTTTTETPSVPGTGFDIKPGDGTAPVVTIEPTGDPDSGGEKGASKQPEVPPVPPTPPAPDSEDDLNNKKTKKEDDGDL